MNATAAPVARPDRCSHEEWALRIRLAQCYHLVDYFGWSETIFNHISARLDGQSGVYLVNPFGLHYTEVTPANLIKVDVEGRKVEPSPYDGNPAGFALHGAIHAARADVHCVIHTHTNAVSAVAQKKAGISHDNFYGAQLTGRVGYHDFEGITLFAEEKGRMLASLGGKEVLVLRNHGVAVAGADIPRAFLLLWIVQRAAEIQCQAGALPGEETVLSDAVRHKCADLAAMLVREQGYANKFFDAMVRRMIAVRGAPW